ncbi:MAG: DUF4012 domain-containing protein [Actinomycetota bacterium]
MRRKALLALALVCALLVLCGIYTAVTVGRHLLAARSALSGSIGSLDTPVIAAAEKDLRAASDAFNDGPVQVLRLVPVIRQNLDALEAAATASVRVVEQAGQLRSGLDRIEEEGLIQEGAVRLDLLQSLRDPLTYESQNFLALKRSVDEHLSGWLLPGLWSELDSLAERSQTLSAATDRAAAVLGQVSPLLGYEGRRTYLVMIINNAELRGAGGIPSALGTLSVDRGRLHLGRFYYYRKLADPPHKRVPAPADFERRFARYKANTTLWVNTTLDPDVPDTAIVASRLFKLSTGIATDGVLVADPRGIAALLSPDAEVPISDDRSLAASEIPEFSYATSYEELGGASSARRDASLQLGRSAFELLINEEGSASGLDSVGEALAAGHLRFVSLHAAEAGPLEAAGASGALEPPESDLVMATVQNLGAGKLDFHAIRAIEHSCDVTNEAYAECVTKMTLRNDAPSGLPRYVAPNDPYGIMKSFAEIYVPGAAEVRGVFRGDVPIDYSQGKQDGLVALGVRMEIERGEEDTLSVGYRLPLGDEPYGLQVLPQPLARDAEITVSLEVRDDQTVRGPGEVEDGIFTYAGRLTGEQSFRVQPDARSGLSKLWQKVVRFWTEPLF